jgi:hypothetical protein
MAIEVIRGNLLGEDPAESAGCTRALLGSEAAHRHFRLSVNTLPSLPLGKRISSSHESVGAISATSARSARLPGLIHDLP